jgi:hypothetical protein
VADSPNRTTARPLPTLCGVEPLCPRLGERLLGSCDNDKPTGADAGPLCLVAGSGSLITELIAG